LNCWKVLGIKRTGDIREIKRAYARKLRDHPPEDDPEGFMLLRECYELALKSAEKQNRRAEKLVKPVDESVQSGEPTQPVDQSAETILPEALSPADTSADTSAVNSIVNKLEELYNDFKRRMDPDEWKQLFNGLGVSELRTAEKPFVDFLNEHYVLPFSVWQYLDTEISLRDNENFHRNFLADEHNDVCTPIPEMFREIQDPGFDISFYAGLRVNAYVAYQFENWNIAEALARQAIELYKDDYLIQIILGAALRATDRERESVIVYQRAFELDPNFGLCQRLLRTYIDLDDYEMALKIFKMLRKLYYKKKKVEQKLSRDTLMEYEKLFLEYKVKKRRITKIRSSWQRTMLGEMRHFRYVTPRGYKRFLYSCLLFLVALFGSITLLAFINGQL